MFYALVKIMGCKPFCFRLIYLFISVYVCALKLCLNVKKKDRASECVFKAQSFFADFFQFILVFQSIVGH